MQRKSTNFPPRISPPGGIFTKPSATYFKSTQLVHKLLRRRIIKDVGHGLIYTVTKLCKCGVFPPRQTHSTQHTDRQTDRQHRQDTQTGFSDSTQTPQRHLTRTAHRYHTHSTYRDRAHTAYTAHTAHTANIANIQHTHKHIL